VVDTCTLETLLYVHFLEIVEILASSVAYIEPIGSEDVLVFAGAA
jgi:hypothetical protein